MALGWSASEAKIGQWPPISTTYAFGIIFHRENKEKGEPTILYCTVVYDVVYLPSGGVQQVLHGVGVIIDARLVCQQQTV